ncbi:MAG TPA: hypothetical protein PLL83_06545 [Rhodoferax sp.]|jgi:hypothetical protein|nr:hypothetical protein [Rhodoferax sp.]HPW84026.1 hypothetical protein [Rhodoferax sp.]HQC85323.1 hypothetical protein [Rhodoferax sp.]HQY76634.1 hypothetical protein [Rhodoferax sp.]
MPTRRNILLATIALAVLMAVFAMYTQPDFLVQMANQLWSCF